MTETGCGRGHGLVVGGRYDQGLGLAGWWVWGQGLGMEGPKLAVPWWWVWPGPGCWRD